MLMLNFGQCFLIILKKDNGKHTILNSFFPDRMFYEESKLSKLLLTVRHKLDQWYATYYRDYQEQLAIAVGERGISDGSFKIIRII
jgi:superoxide dismutase